MDRSPDDATTAERANSAASTDKARLDPLVGEAPQDGATAATQATPDAAAIRSVLEGRRDSGSPIARRSFFSDRIDRSLFLLFAGAGVAAVGALKLGFRVYDLWTAVPPVGLLIAYAVVIKSRPYFRLHPDRLGDNCYYLGFIFTLASLAFALIQLEDVVGSARASLLDSLIGNFGIALFSTIVGIVLRVYFIQARREIEDEEEQLRQELEAVATRLKDQLGLAVLDLEGFRIRTNQVLEEQLENAAQAFSQIQQSMAREASSAGETVAKYQSDAHAKFSQVQVDMTREAAAVVERFAALQKNVTDEYAHIQQNMALQARATAEKLAGIQSELADRVGSLSLAIRSSTSEISGSVDKVARGVRQLLSRVEKIEAPPDLLVRPLQQVEGRISSLASTLERLTDSDAKRSEAFERATAEMLKQLAVLTETSRFGRLENAAEHLGEQLTAVATRLMAYQASIDGLIAGAGREQAALAGIRETLQQDALNSADALHSLEATLSDVARGIASRLG
jgi:hypothetical protein